jgi:hypothetical protein
MTIAPHNPKANLKQYDRDFYAWTLAIVLYI